MITLQFLVTSLIVVLIPGTGVVFTVSTGLAQGRRASVYASLGCTAGIVPHLLASMLGLSAVMHTSALAFQALKFAGVAYLFYLAWTTWRDRGAFAVDRDATAAPLPMRSLVTRAALLNTLNPKLTIFFLAFLPQFVDPAASVPALQILALGLWFDFAGTLVNIIIALAAAGAAARLRHVAWLGRVARWLAATAMGALAVQLALSARRQA